MHVDMTSRYILYACVILCIWSIQTTTEPAAEPLHQDTSAHAKQTRIIPNLIFLQTTINSTINSTNLTNLRSTQTLLFYIEAAFLPGHNLSISVKHARLLSDSSKHMHILRQTGSVVQLQRENNGSHGQPVMLPMRRPKGTHPGGSTSASSCGLRPLEGLKWLAMLVPPGDPSTSQSTHCGRVISKCIQIAQGLCSSPDLRINLQELQFFSTARNMTTRPIPLGETEVQVAELWTKFPRVVLPIPGRSIVSATRLRPLLACLQASNSRRCRSKHPPTPWSGWMSRTVWTAWSPGQLIFVAAKHQIDRWRFTADEDSLRAPDPSKVMAPEFADVCTSLWS